MPNATQSDAIYSTRFSVSRSVRPFKGSRILPLLTLLSLTLFSPQRSHAGFFDPVIQTAGDVITLGGNARQRDWEACESAKRQRVLELTTQIGEVDRQIAIVDEFINGAQAQIILLEGERTFINSQSPAIEVLPVTLKILESQQGSLSEVAAALKKTMEEQNQNQRNLESWRLSLESIIPGLSAQDKAVAQLLLYQISMAAASSEVSLIENVLRALAAPEDALVERLSIAWSQLTESRQTRLNQLNAVQAELTDKVAKANNQRQKLQGDKQKLSQDLANKQAQSC